MPLTMVQGCVDATKMYMLFENHYQQAGIRLSLVYRQIVYPQ